MKRILFIMLIHLLASGFHAMAQGDLLITQKRVVFEGNKQREELDLVNIGNDTATYSVSFVQFNQNEDGGYIAIEKPDSGQMFADPYLRIFPRTVTLAPREPQIIMLQCRRKPDMTPGEYRSHLYFRSEQDYRPLGTKKKDTTSLTVQLIPIYGVSIPIIIRSGETNVSSSITGLKLEILQDTISFLKFTLNRTGNISSYGQLTVEYTPLHGKPYQICLLKNVAVFTCINKRNISIRLNKISGMNFNSGMLKVRYTSPKEEKYLVYAEAELELK